MANVFKVTEGVYVGKAADAKPTDVSEGVVFIETDGGFYFRRAGSWTAPAIWKTGDGTAAAPSHTFDADTDTGWYRIGANNPALALGGALAFDFTVVTGLLALTGWGSGGNQFDLRGKSNRGSVAAPAISWTGDALLALRGYGYDGTSYINSASILLDCMGTVASTRVPGRVRIYTHTDAAPSVETLRLTIDSAGKLTATGNIVFSGLAAAGAGTTLIIDASNNIIPLASQAMYKSNPHSLTIDTSRVYSLMPKTFTWNELTTTPGVEDFGLIAEEVAAILPELVQFKDGKPVSVKYDRLAVLLLPEIAKIKRQLAAA